MSGNQGISRLLPVRNFFISSMIAGTLAVIG